MPPNELYTPAPQGLSAADAAIRLKADGPNELPTPDRRNFIRVLWEVIRQPMFALLIGGGVVYLLLGDRLDLLLSHSITDRIALGPRAGQKAFTLRSLPGTINSWGLKCLFPVDVGILCPLRAKQEMSQRPQRPFQWL